MMMMEVAEQKRRSDGFLHSCEGGAGGCSISSNGSHNCSVASNKRLKTGCGGGGERGGSMAIKERKDKIGERVAALQQLVSPFGKTDTASVLQEATGYIKFLHEQLQVLSAPYLRSTPMVKLQESEYCSLSSVGLCLMPVGRTLRIARSNGADIWAPTNTTNG